MTVALYGGKFDPPHTGHLNVALEVLKKMPEIDELWLIPAKTHQWREIHAPGEDRLNMLRTFSKYNKNIKVCDIELKRNKPTTTIDTVRELKKLYPEHNFLWLMGSDNVPTFHLWNDHAELAQLIKFIIFPRPGHPTGKLPPNFSLIPKWKIAVNHFSATSIREAIAKGKNVRQFLTPEVARYVKTYKPY